MRISILCSNHEHPVFPLLDTWTKSHADGHEIELLDRKQKLSGGNILFLISCHEIIDSELRGNYDVVLVIHASDLPFGRGWSPHIWQILEGKNRFKVTLLEAAELVDSGDIWAQRELLLEGHELFDEINSKLFAVELELMDFAVANFGRVTPRKQEECGATYFLRRTPDESRLDPNGTLAEQFDLLRVSDNKRFPAYFDLRGHRYYVQLSKDRKYQ